MDKSLAARRRLLAVNKVIEMFGESAVLPELVATQPEMVLAEALQRMSERVKVLQEAHKKSAAMIRKLEERVTALEEGAE